MDFDGDGDGDGDEFILLIVETLQETLRDNCFQPLSKDQRSCMKIHWLLMLNS